MNTNTKTKMKGMCVFDIDNTITCNKKNAKELIGWCKKNHFGVGIVTARTHPVPPLDWRALGFSPADLQSRFHYNPFALRQTGQQHGQTKAYAMEQLRTESNVADRRCMLLLDDMGYNIRETQKEGFSALQVGRGGQRQCGLSTTDMEAAKAIMKRCL